MKRLLLVFAFMVAGLQAQMNRPTQHVLAVADTVVAGFIGSSTADIKGQGDTLWFGTSHGLSVTYDNGQSFVSITPRYSDIGVGSISGLAVSGDTVWVATAFDSLVAEESLDTGGGISRSFDSGHTWEYLGQPMDSLVYVDGEAQVYSPMVVFGDTILAVDVVTPINNPSYDLAYDGQRIWTASFAGGLRVSHDFGTTWQRVLLPWDDQTRLDSLTLLSLAEDIDTDPEYYALDPVTHLNHRVFSVIAYGDEVWVGTAGGVNHSNDGGRSWERFSYTNTNITGNFVVALHRQQKSTGDIIWASTVTTGPFDYTGVSFYDVNAGYWRSAELDTWAYNFGSSDEAIYSATQTGLYKSRDGRHHSHLPPIQHTDGSEIIFSDRVYSVFVNDDDAVWVGTGDGIAVSRDDAVTWTITKARPEQDPDDFFAYPNPFTPRYDKQLLGQGYVLLRFSANAGESIDLTIFDFAMEKVREVVVNEQTPFSGVQERTWNGRNEAGYLVANGTYFARLTLDDRTLWTKIMVIN